MSPKISACFLKTPTVEELNDNKELHFPDVSVVPFDYQGTKSISVRPSVIVEFINWIQGADTDHRKDDGRQAVAIRTFDEYIELYALAQWFRIPALWNWCVEEVKCLRSKDSVGHEGIRPFMRMTMLLQDDHEYKPFKVPEDGHVRLPRRWVVESSAKGIQGTLFTRP